MDFDREAEPDFEDVVFNEDADEVAPMVFPAPIEWGEPIKEPPEGDLNARIAELLNKRKVPVPVAKVDAANRPKKGLVRLSYDNGEVSILTNQALVSNLSSRKMEAGAEWIPEYVRVVDLEYIEERGSFLPVYIVVTEQKPGIRNLSFVDNFDNYKNDGLYHDSIVKSISLPYLVNVFVIKTQKNGVLELDTTYCLSFYRTLPLTGYSDELLICNLPNVRIDAWNEDLPNSCIGWTCFHNAPEEVTSVYPIGTEGVFEGESRKNAVLRMVTGLLDYSANSTFTGEPEINTAWDATRNVVEECRNLDTWEAASIENPDFVLGADWIPHPERATLQNVIDSIRDSLFCVPSPVFYGGDVAVNAPLGAISTNRLKKAVDGAKEIVYKMF